MLEKMPELVVPLINEVFGTNYPADIAVEQQRNEHQTKNGEKITDSRLKIADKIYHIECQSTGDAEMVIRMIEYDFAVSLETKQIENGRYKIYFPHSCVLYLRGKGRKDTLGMDIIMPDGRVIKYELPAIYIERYTQDVIFQSRGIADRLVNPVLFRRVNIRFHIVKITRQNRDDHKIRSRQCLPCAPHRMIIPHRARALGVPIKVADHLIVLRCGKIDIVKINISRHIPTRREIAHQPPAPAARAAADVSDFHLFRPSVTVNHKKTSNFPC